MRLQNVSKTLSAVIFSFPLHNGEAIANSFDPWKKNACAGAQNVVADPLQGLGEKEGAPPVGKQYEIKLRLNDSTEIQ